MRLVMLSITCSLYVLLMVHLYYPIRLLRRLFRSRSHYYFRSILLF